MTTQEMIAVLSAFEQGKKIEYSNKGKDIYNITNDPCWDFYSFDYRIVEEPEYVPYDGSQEGTLVGKIVVVNETILTIIGENNQSESSNILIAGTNLWISYKELLDMFTFLDGQPCGMLKK